MVLTSANANTLTNNAITITNSTELETETALLEAQIRQAAGLKRFTLSYNARIIGNPIGDPSVDTNLTAQQLSFRDTFLNAGYVITQDPDTLYWIFSWESVSIEALVTIYSVRTTVSPGAIEAQTISAIETYLDGLTPAVTSRVELVTINGGDILETEFGAVASVFYEYNVIVQQQDDTDHSVGITTALDTSGLGYNSATPNVKTYKVTA